MSRVVFRRRLLPPHLCSESMDENSLVSERSAMFKVLVLKTTEVIPYSSVFIELDCKYWSAEQEKALREKMQE